VAYKRTPYVENKRAEARERLVMAALSLLAQGGWRQVQMSAVAESAGLSTGAVYLHFPSKTELLAEAYRTQAGNEFIDGKRLGDIVVSAEIQSLDTFR